MRPLGRSWGWELSIPKSGPYTKDECTLEWEGWGRAVTVPLETDHPGLVWDSPSQYCRHHQTPVWAAPVCLGSQQSLWFAGPWSGRV